MFHFLLLPDLSPGDEEKAFRAAAWLMLTVLACAAKEVPEVVSLLYMLRPRRRVGFSTSVASVQPKRTKVSNSVTASTFLSSKNRIVPGSSVPNGSSPASSSDEKDRDEPQNDYYRGT
jgi:hypothetical protein